MLNKKPSIATIYRTCAGCVSRNPQDETPKEMKLVAVNNYYMFGVYCCVVCGKETNIDIPQPYDKDVQE